jgi:hypothetical protein
MRLYRPFIVAFLIVAMGFVIVPVQFIHSLYDHTDTIDHLEADGGPSLGNEHHHCLILKIEWSEYLIVSQVAITHDEHVPKTFFFHYINPYLFLHNQHKEQRGPPYLIKTGFGV